MHALLRYFTAGHLMPGPTQETSRACEALAHQLDASLPDVPEKTVALRKLLEAKDAAVRAALDVPAP